MKDRYTLPVLLLIFVALAAVIVVAGWLCSQWFPLARMDAAGAYGPMRQQLWATILFMLVLLLGAAAGVGLIWRDRSAGFDRERANSAEALREINQNLDITLKLIGDAVIATDAAGKIVRMNPVAEKLTGWPAVDAMGRPLAEVFSVIDAQTRQPVADPVAKVLETGCIIGLANHTALIARDGTERQITDSAAPIQNAAGQAVGVVLIFRDVTPDYVAAKRLGLLDRAINAAGEGICITGPNAAGNPLLYVNHGFEHLTGYAAEEVLGQNMRFLQGADTDQGTVERMRAAIQSEQEFTTELLNYRKDGTSFWNHISITPVRDAAGKVRHLVAILHDITERKRRECEIERLNRLYSALSVLNQTIAGVTSREELFREVCRIAAENAEFKVAWIGWVDPQTHMVNPIARSGDDEGYLDGIEVFADDRPEGHGPVGTCIREKKTIIVDDFLNDSRTVRWHAAAAPHGLRGVAALPIRFRGEVCGALTVYSDEPNVFQDKEVALLEEAAAAVSVALESLDREAQRKRSEEALREERDYTQSIIRSMADMLVVVAPDGRIATVNQASCDLLGYAEHELIGQPATLLFEEEEEDEEAEDESLHSMLAQYSLPVKRTVLRRLVKEGSVSNVEKSLRTKTGDRIPVLLSGAIMRDDGKTRGIVCLALDISERKREQDALRQANFCVQHAGDGIYWIDSEARIIFANQQASEVLEYSCGELQAMTVFDIDPVFTRELWGTHWEAIRQEKSFVIESCHRTKTGRIFPVEISVNYMAFDGKHYNCAIARDISARKEAEEKMRASEEKYRTYINNSPTGIFVADLTGRYVEVNASACRLLGYSEEELTQMTISDVVAPEDVQSAMTAFQNILQAGSAVRAEYCFVRKDRSRFFMSVDAVKVRNDRVIGFCADITKRMDAERSLTQHSEALQQTNQRLEEACHKADAANRAKSEFLANMSHEIRTPMTAIIGYTDMLASPHLPYEQQREFLAGIRRNGNALLELISGILDLSRIEAGKLTVESIVCSPRQVADDVVAMLSERASRK